MAGDWIPMRLDLYEDPSVIALAEYMEVREEVIVGYLHKMWSWVSRQCHDGSVTGVTLVALGRVIGLPGFPERVRELTPWLEYTEGDIPTITIPKWDSWLSESAKARALAARRKRLSRLKPVTEVSRRERDKSVTTVQDSTVQDSTGQKRTRRKAPLPPLPDALTELQPDWDDWIRHRSEKRSSVTPTQAKKQIQELEGWGLARSTVAIRHSITKGWTGIFEPSDGNGAKPGQHIVGDVTF